MNNLLKIKFDTAKEAEIVFEFEALQFLYKQFDHIEQKNLHR